MAEEKEIGGTMICPVGMPNIVIEALLQDFKDSWKEWLIFLGWDVPSSVVKGWFR
jgi:hypothetical protein